MKLRAVSLLAPWFLCAAASAQAPIWKADPVHSRVEFRVQHMVISEVTGRFTAFDAVLTQTGDDFTSGRIDASIQANSVNTDNAMRDSDLKSDNFLDVEKYPLITFRSASIEKTGENTYRIKGDLTIRGITKPVVLDAAYNGEVKDPMGNTRRGFKATVTIDRFDFGVKWNKTLDTGGLVVGKDVSITLLMEMVKQKV